MLPIIFVMPIFQLLILSYAATFEIKNANIAFVDMDQSNASRELISKFKGSPFFKVVGNSFSMKALEKPMLRKEVEIIVEIPPDFEKKLMTGQSVSTQIITDAVNGSAANLMTYYASMIFMDFNRHIIIEHLGKDLMGSQIKVIPRYWFNPNLDYKTYMVPGILVLLVTLIGAFLSGMNVVRERRLAPSNS